MGPRPQTQWLDCSFPIGGFPFTPKALSVVGKVMLPFPHRKKHTSFFPLMQTIWRKDVIEENSRPPELEQLGSLPTQAPQCGSHKTETLAAVL